MLEQKGALELNDEMILMPWIARTAKFMHVYMNQQFKNHDIPLTPKQWILLRYLIQDDGRDQKHLALITERDKTSLTRLISSMEKKELVMRKANPLDKRSNKIYITEKGIKAYETAMPIVNDARQLFEEGLDRGEIETATRTIRKLHDHLKELTLQNSDDQCDR